jgi:hypothetical protein
MDDIDEMAKALSFALSEMMAEDGPIPGSVLHKILSSREDAASTAALAVFVCGAFGVTIDVAYAIVDRVGQAAGAVSDDVSGRDEAN